MKKFLAVIALALVLVLGTSPAWAAPITGTYTLAGATTGTGPWTMTSTDTTSSILRFVFGASVLFGDLTDLSVDYIALLGGIGEGAPRIALVTDSDNDNVADGQILIHFGPPGTLVDATLGPGNTGNLLALTDVGRYDLGGIGGSAYTDRAAALALAANIPVLRASLILDSYGGNDRTFTINGISVADDTPSTAVPEPASLMLFGTGLSAIALGSRRRKKAVVRRF